MTTDHPQTEFLRQIIDTSALSGGQTGRTVQTVQTAAVLYSVQHPTELSLILPHYTTSATSGLVLAGRREEGGLAAIIPLLVQAPVQGSAQGENVSLSHNTNTHWASLLHIYSMSPEIVN